MINNCKVFASFDYKITHNQQAEQKNQGIFNEFNQLNYSRLNFICVHLDVLCTNKKDNIFFILSLHSCIWRQIRQKPYQGPFSS